MDERASIPPTLPRRDPTTSGWQDPPDAIANLRSMAELPDTADVVIIGSGISGASIALGLLEVNKGLNMIMLEARQACSGATGRNDRCRSINLTKFDAGGHTKAASYHSFYDNVQEIGPEEAIKLVRLEYNNIKAVHNFSRLHSIECELTSRDTVDIIYDENQWHMGVQSIELMQKLMPEDLDGAAQYTFHSAEEARNIFYCKGDKAIGAITYQAGSLSAYKLVIGMLKLGLEQGLNLQTNTPATSLRRDINDTWEVRTPRGVIVTKQVVLATNGYTGFLYNNLRSIIVPLRGQITVHRPGINMPKDGLRTTYSFVYANGYEYMISRPMDSPYARDIIMGGGLVKAPQEGLCEYGTTDDTTLDLDIHQYLSETTPRYFGDAWGDDHPDGRIRQAWSGIMGYSPDSRPFVGEIPHEKGLFISASFQGHGMVLCFLCAKALVKMMCGDEGDLDNWFPNCFKITEERMRNRF